MTNRLAILLFVLIASIASATPVFAGSGLQHGDFLNKAENCAICHRTQDSRQSTRNLSQKAFCYSCHGRSRSGSNLNVQDGKDSNGDGLRGGGFENAVMDPGLTGTPTSKPVTSAHSVDGSLVRVWGSGTINAAADYGNMAAMECSSCHNPHGNGNYRMLRGMPEGTFNEEQASRVDVPDEELPAYAITYDAATRYRDTSYAPANLGQWCAQCHTRYQAGGGAGHTPSGDAVFNYRHNSADLPGGCLSCHVAHGTTSAMGPHSGAVPLPDGTPGQGIKDSRLLQTDNRGICLRCHTSSDLTNN